MKTNYFDHFNSTTLPKVKTYGIRAQYIPLQKNVLESDIPIAEEDEQPVVVTSGSRSGNNSGGGTVVIYNDNGDGSRTIRREQGIEGQGITLHQYTHPFAIHDGKRIDLNLELNEQTLKRFADFLGEKGVPVKITSLTRKGATTSNGSVSRHHYGKAMDVVPVNGDFSALRRLMLNDPEVINAMNNLGIGYLDETTEEMLKKTGGTGPHFHYGDDRSAVQYYQSQLAQQ